jgi:uncharacterized membrane protein HdeD (DUF308 family)
MRESALFPWWSVLLAGVLSVLLGIVVLAWPEASLRVIAALLGVGLLLGGVGRIFNSLTDGRSVCRRVRAGLAGVLLLLGGIVSLSSVATSLAVLSLLVAGIWLLTGLARTMTSTRATGTSRQRLLATGMLSIGVGVIFVSAPTVSLLTLILAIGGALVVTGAIQVVVGMNLRKHAASLD